MNRHFLVFCKLLKLIFALGIIFCIFSEFIVNKYKIKCLNELIKFCCLPNAVFASSNFADVIGSKNFTIKQNIRNFFSKINPITQSYNRNLDNLNLQRDGIEIIRDEKYLGFVIDTSKFSVLPISWSDDCGLLEQIKRLNGLLELSSSNSSNFNISNKKIIAGVNGAFYSSNAALGQVIINSQMPKNIKQQVSTKFPKACIIVLADSDGNQKIVIGETNVSANQILKKCQSKDGFLKCFTYLNTSVDQKYKLLHLLGGAGWIVRNGKDVHMEAYTKQNFRFKKENQDARHTVVASSFENRLLHFLVFENGYNLSAIANILLNKFPYKISDAIFYDGGSSSTIVFNNSYLVSPLYLIDKARFTGLTIIRHGDKNASNASMQ